MDYMRPVKTNDPRIRSICLAAFPAYRGRKFSVSTNIPDQLRSYWDGGSRDYYAFVNLVTRRVEPLPSHHPLLPPGIAIVCHSIVAGKDMGCEVMVNPCDLAPLLPK